MNSQAYFSKFGMPLGRRGARGWSSAAGRSCCFPAPVPHGPRGDAVSTAGAHRNRSAMCMPITPSAAMITASQTPATIHSISRW